MRIAFIGGGNMGVTYARAFVRSKIVDKEALLIVEKMAESRSKLKAEDIAEIHDNIDSKLADYDYIIVAVKPQDFLSIVPVLKQILHKKQIVISFMAGVTITSMKELLDHENIVRAMPNTPAQLGFGVTGFVAAESVDESVVKEIDSLLETTGKSVFMENEEMLDALTAISGSGPAYFYYFAKYMMEAGVELGLEANVVEMLVKQTMLGSFQMMDNSDSSPDELIALVKSKGGTTEAALNHFDRTQVGENIIGALKAAEHRAKELSKDIIK